MAKTYRHSRFHHASFFLRLFVFLLKIVVALEVTPDSPCAPMCIDQPRLNVSDYRSSFTFVEDITCRDTDYEGQNSTFAGRKFKSCISCQQNSTFVADREFRENRGIENDVYWFLFNIKAPVIWCINNIFGEKQNLDGTQMASSCSSSCDFGLALNERIFETNDTLQYNYCSADGGTFMKNVDQCQNCINELGKSRMLANFLGVMKTACQQTPVPGNTISLSKDVFALTAPTPSPTLQPLATTSTSPLDTDAESAPLSPSGGMIAGIVIGILIFLSLLAFIAYLGLRRRQASRKSNMSPDKGAKYLESDTELDGFSFGKCANEIEDTACFEAYASERPAELGTVTSPRFELASSPGSSAHGWSLPGTAR